MEITTKFRIRDVVQMHTHDIHPKRFYDAIDGNMVCGVVVGIYINHYENVFYGVKRNTHVDEKVRLYAEWELELVSTAPERTPPDIIAATASRLPTIPVVPLKNIGVEKPSAGKECESPPDPLGKKLYGELQTLGQYFHNINNTHAAAQVLVITKRYEPEYAELTAIPD